MSESRSLAEVIRIAIYLVVLCLVAVISDGWWCHVVGAIALVSSLSVQLLLQRPTFYRIGMAWELGFLFIVSIEGLTAAESIIGDVAPEAYHAASRYLVGASAASLLGYSFTFRERGFALRPWHREVKLKSAGPLLLIATTYAVYLLHSIPEVISLASVGRNDTWLTIESRSASETLIDYVALASQLVVAPMIVYYVLWVMHKHVIIAVVLTFPLFVLQLLSGTRFHLLFSAFGVAVVYFASRPVSLRTMLRLTAVAAVIVVISVLMLRVRNTGMTQANADVLSAAVRTEEVASGEGVVATMSMIVDYFSHREHAYGASTAGLVLFWIPRSIWPDKPTFIGYWFPREYGLTGFSEIHSAAATFAADPYVDFGFVGGILLCGAIGIGLARVDGWSARTIARQGHPAIVIASVLYGATFFAVRSLDTAIASLGGVVLIGCAFVKLVGTASDLRLAAGARDLAVGALEATQRPPTFVHAREPVSY